MALPRSAIEIPGKQLNDLRLALNDVLAAIKNGTSQTAALNFVPVADSTGKLDNSWLHMGAGGGIDADYLRGEPPVFGATTALSIAQRDAAGRLQGATPSASSDLATKGYVDTGGANQLGTYFESSEQNVAIDDFFSVNHGLGTTPKLVQVVLRNKTAEFGYSVGDEVLVPLTTTDNLASSFNSTYGVTISWNSTVVRVYPPGTIVSPSGGRGIRIRRIDAPIGRVEDIISETSPTTTKWKFVVRAWK